MKYLLKGLVVHMDDDKRLADVLVDQGRIVSIAPMLPADADTTILNLENCDMFPGFVDVHVHLREPGFSYKETIKTGTAAASRGGYTDVCTMPNLNPTPDSLEHLQVQLDIIKKDASVHVYPYAAITVGEKGEELAQLEDMAPHVIGFSDDGKGVQKDEMMRVSMQKAKALDRPVVAHCEDERLLFNGYIHDGEYAKQNKHRGISSASEWKQVERDLELVRETGCAYHICHISTKESVELLRNAKKEGLNVSGETGPHYLVLTDADLQEDGRFKMNPPLRSQEDQDALIAGLKDGTIDFIATDHAPHSDEEKSKGLEKSMMGIVGLETAFALLYTELVQKNVCSLEELLGWLHKKPRDRFRIGTKLQVGEMANFTVFDLSQTYEIDPEEFLTKGKSMPFVGKTVYGRCKLTMVDGKIAWQEDSLEH